MCIFFKEAVNTILRQKWRCSICQKKIITETKTTTIITTTEITTITTIKATTIKTTKILVTIANSSYKLVRQIDGLSICLFFFYLFSKYGFKNFPV